MFSRLSKKFNPHKLQKELTEKRKSQRDLFLHYRKNIINFKKIESTGIDISPSMRLAKKSNDVTLNRHEELRKKQATLNRVTKLLETVNRGDHVTLTIFGETKHGVCNGFDNKKGIIHLKTGFFETTQYEVSDITNVIKI